MTKDFVFLSAAALYGCIAWSCGGNGNVPEDETTEDGVAPDHADPAADEPSDPIGDVRDEETPGETVSDGAGDEIPSGTPFIAGVDQQDGTVTVTGSGFGVKVPAGPLISSYDHSDAANDWSSGTLGGNWTTGGPVSLVAENPRAPVPQSSYKAAFVFGTDYNSLRFDHPVAEDKLYISMWLYRDGEDLRQITGSGNNAKFVRVYQSAEAVNDGNWVLTVGANADTGLPEAIKAGGDNMGMCPGWSIAYTAADAYMDTVPLWGVGEGTVLPQARTWEHYESYMDYASVLGGTDASHVLQKDGRTLWRSIDISTNVEGQADERRWVLMGFVSGGFITPHNGYLDQVYIDNTPARVVLADREDYSWPDYGDEAHTEIQVCSAWSDGSIAFTLNRGSFPAGSTVYVYVVNPDGAISSGHSLLLE